MKFKILICGSREIRDKEFVFKTLDFLTSNKDLSEIEIHTPKLNEKVIAALKKCNFNN